MSQTGVKAFDRTLQTTNIWLNEILEEMGWEDKHRAYHALWTVLHALRDLLSVDEAASFAAQLPMLIRGVYYKGWNPSKVPVRQRKKEQFLNQIAEGYRMEPEVDAEKITRAVFQVLSRHVTLGEVEGITFLLSEELRTLWPAPI